MRPESYKIRGFRKLILMLLDSRISILKRDVLNSFNYPVHYTKLSNSAIICICKCFVRILVGDLHIRPALGGMAILGLSGKPNLSNYTK